MNHLLTFLRLKTGAKAKLVGFNLNCHMFLLETKLKMNECSLNM